MKVPFNMKIILLLTFIATCSSIHVQEAFVGETVTLHCLSSDQNHRFQFWQIPHEIVGPGMNVSRVKYKYEILTGTLFIHAFSTNQHGVYTCYCKNIINSTFKVDSIELIVKENWETSYETDYMTNVYRIVTIASVSVILVCVLCILYHLRSKPLNLISASSMDGPEDERFLPEAMEMTAHLDTEFPREFTTTAQIN